MIGTSIEQAAALLRKNEVVAIPTETVYGLAANGLNLEAVAKIYQIKQRPPNNPLILHTHSLASAIALVTTMPPWAKQLANAFWPGPLTLLLPKKEQIPKITTAGLTRVGLRIPDHPITLKLLEKLPFPVRTLLDRGFAFLFLRDFFFDFISAIMALLSSSSIR